MDESPSPVYRPSPLYPNVLGALDQLSTNLRWSWDKPTQDLFAAIDPCTVGAMRSSGGAAGRGEPSALDELALDAEFWAPSMSWRPT